MKVFALSLGEWYMHGNSTFCIRWRAEPWYLDLNLRLPRTPDVYGIVVVTGIKIEN
jgi:hypothetical protein